MMKDQQEAEKKKVQSQEIQVALSKQTVQIEEKRKDVMADLEKVEPAVIDAQTGKSFYKICFRCYSFFISGRCFNINCFLTSLKDFL